MPTSVSTKASSLNLFFSIKVPHNILFGGKRKYSIDKNKNVKQLDQSTDRLPGKENSEIDWSPSKKDHECRPRYVGLIV